jgi:hypothetical protein
MWLVSDLTPAGVALIWPAPALDRDGLLRALAALLVACAVATLFSPLTSRWDGCPCRGARVLRPTIDLPRPNSAPLSTGPFLPMSTIPHSALLLAVIGSPCPYCSQTRQIPDRPPSRDHSSLDRRAMRSPTTSRWSAAVATPTRALDRWGNGLRACHELATLAPIMWQRSLSAV